MSGSDAKSVREDLDSAAVEGTAIDEPQRSFNGGARSLPGRREGGRLRSAPQARPKSGRLGCGRRGKKANVDSPSRTNRAHGPAVNAGCSHTRKETPVVAAIPGYAGALAFLCIEHCILALVSPSWTESESGELVFAPDAICKCEPSLRDPGMTLCHRFSGTRWRFQRRSKAFS